MALTELQKRKFKVAFDSQDVDGTGVLTQEDFQRLIDNLTNINDKPNTEATALYEEMWQDLLSKADVDKSGGVTLDEWYDYIEQLISDEERLDKYVINTAVTVLNSLDSTGNNKINLDEYKVLAAALNISESDADTAFEKLDKSGDGSLDIDELKENIKEFYLTEDENAPGNWLFGKF